MNDACGKDCCRTTIPSICYNRRQCVCHNPSAHDMRTTDTKQDRLWHLSNLNDRRSPDVEGNY